MSVFFVHPSHRPESHWLLGGRVGFIATILDFQRLYFLVTANKNTEENFHCFPFYAIFPKIYDITGFYQCHLDHRE